MSTKAAHTPTPWRLTDDWIKAYMGPNVPRGIEANKNGYAILEPNWTSNGTNNRYPTPEEAIANLEIVITAVNHHQELITRLYNLVNAVETTMSLLNCSAEVNMATHEARETLKKVIQ